MSDRHDGLAQVRYRVETKLYTGLLHSYPVRLIKSCPVVYIVVCSCCQSVYMAPPSENTYHSLFTLSTMFDW